MNEYIIETYELSKNFGKQKAVDSVNIKIKTGTIYGLLGKNGAGKTTFMCMLLDLVKSTSGKSYILGYDTQEEGKKIYPKVGSIIETLGFYSNLTGLENLELFSKLHETNSQNNISNVLKIVSLHDNKDKLFKNYSLGMKQRLGIALALLKEPEILILDEPINGLDPVGILEIRNLLKKLTKEFSMTILISSHILSEIEQIADVICIMNEGKLIKEITIDELHENINNYVRFQVSDSIKACKLLNKIGLIDKVDFEVVNKSDINLLTHLDLVSQINKSFVDNSIDVFQIKSINENLEEYFISLIGD